MPRGFEGETVEQEARGGGAGGISASDIEAGRDDASLRAEARALRDAASPLNNPRTQIDALVNQYTSQYGPLSRGAFNSIYGRTMQNPGGINTLGYGLANTLGKLGIGSGVVTNTVPQLSGTVFGTKNALGETLISRGGKTMGMSAEDYYSGKTPSELGYDSELGLNTYQSKYGYANPTVRELNRAYDQYMNPYNDPNLPGFNPDIYTSYGGRPVTDQVRPGLRSGIFTDMTGTPTAQGPLRTMDTAFSGTDRAAMALAGPTLGGLIQGLTGKKTVVGNVPSMDAMLPTPEMLEAGQTYGGYSRQLGSGLSDILSGIGSLFTGPAKESVPATEAEFKAYEEMYAPVSSQVLPDSINTSQAPGDLRSTAVTQTADLWDTLGVTGAASRGALSPETENWMNSQGITLDQIMKGDIPAGTIMPNGEVYQPEPPQKPVTPQSIENLIRGAISTSGADLRSSQNPLANALAFDTTNMFNTGNNLYQSSRGLGAMDRALMSVPDPIKNALRGMGIGIPSRSAQVYVTPSGGSNAFSRLIGID